MDAETRLGPFAAETELAGKALSPGAPPSIDLETRHLPLILYDDLVNSTRKNPPSLIGSGLLPEHGKMLLIAKTGVGKSVVSLDIAMSLVLGEPLFGAYKKHNDKDGDSPYFPVNQPCRVLYLDAEVGEYGLKERVGTLGQLRAPGLSLSNRFAAVTEHIEPLSLYDPKDTANRGFKALRDIIGSYRPDSELKYVVIVDPLGDFHTVDEDNNAMRMVFQRLSLLQAEFHFAAIIPHHESDKPLMTQSGPTARIGTAKSRGHSSITQKMDTIATLDTIERDENGIAQLKLCWPKVRHGRQPVEGYLLADYGRMYIKWLGPARGQGQKESLTKLSEYRASRGLLDVTKLPLSSTSMQ